MAVTLDSLRKSIGKKNTNSRAFAWLADLEREAGELERALQRVDGGLTLYPNDVAAMLVRAKILFQKGEESSEWWAACVEECEKVLVADPFNLAAQRIMGDAYEKLDNIGERNRCYRRLHDMDPLNSFWKEEYDVVVGGVAAAAMAGEISDTDFSMPSETGNFDMGDEFSEKDSSMAPADKTTAEEQVEPQVAETAEAETKSSDNASIDGDDPFAALASMMPGSDDADDSVMDDLSNSLDSVMDSIGTSTAENPVEELNVDDSISGIDVGSALSDMFGLDDDLEAEESSASGSGADIPENIDEAAEANAASVFSSSKPVADAAPAEDKPVTIDSAFEDIFGEDELPEEKPQAAAQEPVEPAEVAAEPAAEEGGLFEKSADADMNWATGPAPVDESLDKLEDDSLEAPAEEPAPAKAPAEDKPMTIDSAFEDIFGEDELPEEKPQAAIEESVEPAAEPAAEVAPAESDDFELPAEEGGLFEKSADANMSFAMPDDTAEESLDLPSEEPAAPEEPALEAPAEAPVEEKPTTVSSAFEDIFGEDELPTEPAVNAVDVEPLPSLESNTFKIDDEPEAPAETLVEAPAEEPAVESAEEPAVESVEEPAVEPVVESAEQPQVATIEKPQDSFGVDSAFDSLFGGDDDLPEEKPQTEESASADTAAAEEATAPLDDSKSLAEQVNQAEAELEMPEVKSESSDLAKEMGGAFASMFGDDDDLDLPAAKTESVVEPAAEVSNEQEATSAAVEESLATSAEQVISSDLDKSFDNLFGNDDAVTEDLSMPEKPAQAEVPAEAPAEVPEVKASAAAPASDLDSLETEVSGAFKGLFDMDDDALTEEKPSNKGVDFLMSGDSDDEISAGLINNPDAPLDRGAHDLDDSLNTRTLAEIYFDQGLYGKALEIYKDLSQKEPENEDIVNRLAEIEKIYNEKFGGEA